MRHFRLGHEPRAAAQVEQAHHRDEDVVHGHVCGGGDERAGFGNMLQTPRVHFAALAEHHGHAFEQAGGGFRVLRVDFRIVRGTRACRVFLGRIDQMMALRKFRDLFVAQRLDRAARRWFAFRSHISIVPQPPAKAMGGTTESARAQRSARADSKRGIVSL